MKFLKKLLEKLKNLFKKETKQEVPPAVVPVIVPVGENKPFALSLEIDYSKYVGKTPYELMTHPQYGRPHLLPGWDWGKWTAAHKGTVKDPRNHTNTGENTDEINVATSAEVRNSRNLDVPGRWRTLRTGTYTVKNVSAGQRISFYFGNYFGTLKYTVSGPGFSQFVIDTNGSGGFSFQAPETGDYKVDIDAPIATEMSSIDHARR